MKRVFLPLILLGLAAPALAENYRDKTRIEPAEFRIGEVTEKIVGGGPAGSGQNRWITSLQYQGSHFCGGALVAPNWVMTAAHCVTTESASDSGFSVWVGGYDLRVDSQGFRRDVAQIVVHPQYDDNALVNDIALLRLSSNVTGITPVSLATSSTMNGPAAPNQPVTISGWGALSENGGSPDVLHEVLVPVVSNAVCNSPQSYGGEVGSSQVCAGLSSGGRDSCYGDSGGPLWVTAGGTDVHAGVVSWGEGCALPNKYGVYTRTASYRQWVIQLTGATDPAPDPDPDPGPNPDPDPDPNDPGHCEPPPDGQPGIALLSSGEVLSVSGGQDEQQYFAVDVPQGARRLFLDTWGGTGDVDLYVAYERQPDTDDFDYAPYLDGNTERVKVDFPNAGRWYVTLVGYQSYQNANLRAIIRE